MDRFWNRIRQEISRQIHDLAIAAPRMATVTGYDPNRHAIKALVHPESDDPDQTGDVPETGWIPIGTAQTGSNFGVYAPPLPGDQVMLVHREHDAGCGVVLGRVNDVNHPPPAVPAGEIWIVQKSGSYIKLITNGDISITQQTGSFIQLTHDGHITATDKAGSTVVLTNDGKLQLKDASGTSLQFNDNGTVTLTGALLVTGDVTAGTGEARNISLLAHQHLYIPGSNAAAETAAPTANT